MSLGMDESSPPARYKPNKALQHLNRDELLARIEDGAFLRDLAKELGVDKRRLSEYLRQHPEYQAAKEASIEVQLDDAQQALKDARETADIARAREMFRAAAWRAEREHPGRWGVRQVNINIEADGDWGERLRRAKQRTNSTEGDVIDVTPSASD